SQADACIATNDAHGLAHSITSSARARTDVGISRPRLLAVLRLITRSYLVGACTGRSAAFSPLRMRSRQNPWRADGCVSIRPPAVIGRARNADPHPLMDRPRAEMDRPRASAPARSDRIANT